MMESLSNPDTWTALFKIAVINVVLSGDNAVVIALACRSLNPADQKKAFLIGAGGIVVLLTALTAFAAALMSIPYIQMGGSVLLLWIGVKLLLPEEEEGDIKSHSNFWAAVRTIIIADMVMSLDNVLGMAGAAKGHYEMLVLGLVITMPLILFGSALLMKLMERFPIMITLGAGLLGWVAGEMVVGDIAVKNYIEVHAHVLDYFVPITCAAFVVLAGKLLARRHHAALAAAAETAKAAAVRAAGSGAEQNTAQAS